MSAPERIDDAFESGGTRCAGTLYLPAAGGSERPPVVVMAHGFAAERAFGLDRFAERFVERGLAVYVFDYRSFGDSDGEPRQWVSPRRHAEDWRAALAHVRGLPQVDPSRLALWGTSFSGGHVVVVAADDPGVRAVVAQVPYLDLPPTDLPTPRQALGLARAALADRLAQARGEAAVTVPVVGEPGEIAIMTFPGWTGAYGRLVPEGSTWRNAIPARVLLEMPRHRPARVAPRVACPALVVAAAADAGCPLAVVRRVAATMPAARLEVLDCDHFDVYDGEWFERAVALEADFLSGALLASSGPG